MGSVAMGPGGVTKFRGDRIHSTEYCWYCDNCGSFNVIKLPSLRTALIILLAVVITIVYWHSNRSNLQVGSLLLVCVLMQIVWLGIFSFLLSWDIWCIKCRLRIKTSANTRNYRVGDRTVIDIPYKATQKYYYEDDY